MKLDSVEDIISDIRQGRMVVLIDDDEVKGPNEGVVMMAAEHVDAVHVNFMARKARGLVCLALTQERCAVLGLPPMAAEGSGEKSNFTVSIEAREGISTGISAGDRARTIQVAVAATSAVEDIVQPGHIFPLMVEGGGVLTRAGHTEAASDYARLAGLQPAAMIADILTPQGVLANGVELAEFASEHQLKIGSIADLIHFRVVSERTIRKVREGRIDTSFGEFKLAAYRDQTAGQVHIALSQGDIRRDEPTLVRVHVQAAVRDMLTARAPGRPSWNFARCLETVARAGCGVVLLLSRPESTDELLHSIDIALGNAEVASATGQNAQNYMTVGLGSQILRDLGVGKIRLMGAPIKYNAISGFDLEVIEYVAPEGAGNE